MESPFYEIRYNEASNDLWRSEQMFRWSFMLKPKLSIDGDQWCALYGDNLQDGVAGFGDSPDAAYSAFDTAWVEKLKPRKTAADCINDVRGDLAEIARS